MTIRRAIAAAAILTVTALGCQTASAYDRGVTVTTPRGTYTKSVEGSCAGGVCSRNAEFAGPNGGTASRATQCAGGYRFYGCTGTVTGPAGNSLTLHVVGRRRIW